MMLTRSSFAVAGPTFPTEILAKIVSLAVPTPKFDFTQPEWEQGFEYTTLKALCLTSRVFNGLATPLLYSHLVVPTAELGQALIATLDSDKWQSGQWKGKAKEWTKLLVAGIEVDVGMEASGWFVEALLDRLEGGNLEQLAITGLRLRNPASFIDFNKLKYLKLSRIAYRFAPDATPSTLANVTHLYVSDVRKAGQDRATFLRMVKLPSVSCLVLSNTASDLLAGPHPWTFVLGLGSVAASVERITLNEERATVLKELAISSIAFRKLQYLVVSAVEHVGNGLLLGDVLRSLPRPLVLVDLSALSLARTADCAPSLLRAVLRSYRSLRQGTRLRLAERVGRHPGGRAVAAASVNTNSAVVEMARWAKTSGLQVEWV